MEDKDEWYGLSNEDVGGGVKEMPLQDAIHMLLNQRFFWKKHFGISDWWFDAETHFKG